MGASLGACPAQGGGAWKGEGAWYAPGGAGRAVGSGVVPSPSYLVGDLRLTVLSDGTFWQDAGAVFGLVPKIMWQRVTGETNARNQIPLALNCVLLESDGKTVLIETGQGDKDFEIATVLFDPKYPEEE